jgi:hypothetical protein
MAAGIRLVLKAHWHCLFVPFLILTPWSRVLLEKLTGLQLVKKFLAFMEPEGSLQHSHVPATCTYPEPARSSPALNTFFFN